MQEDVQCEMHECSCPLWVQVSEAQPCVGVSPVQEWNHEDGRRVQSHHVGLSHSCAPEAPLMRSACNLHGCEERKEKTTLAGTIVMRSLAVYRAAHA